MEQRTWERAGSKEVSYCQEGRPVGTASLTSEQSEWDTNHPLCSYVPCSNYQKIVSRHQQTREEGSVLLSFCNGKKDLEQVFPQDGKCWKRGNAWKASRCVGQEDKSWAGRSEDTHLDVYANGPETGEFAEKEDNILPCPPLPGKSSPSRCPESLGPQEIPPPRVTDVCSGKAGGNGSEGQRL